MRIKTSRFGEIEVTAEDLLEFSEGLLGFGQLRRFVLLDDPNDEIFAWLQSCENQEIAFPVLEPELFSPNFNVEMSRSDMESLGLEDAGQIRYLTIITIPNDPTQMTANLKAPIVINGKTRAARQCVLQDNSLPIREPIFAKLQQRVIQNPGVSFKARAKTIGAVRVNQREAEA